MSIQSEPRNETLDRRILARLAALRRRIRRYVWIEGLGATVVTAGLLFWFSLTVDWFFEPMAVFRAVLLLAGIALIVRSFVVMIVRRLRCPMTDANMAMLLERHYPQLDDALLTTVELRSPPTEELGRAMLHKTYRVAADHVEETRLKDVFDRRPLRRAILTGLMLVISIVLFGLLTPQSMAIWARRSLLFSGELWPRKTVLSVEGFDDGIRKVARGASLEIVARADLGKPIVPKTVDIQYRTDSGARGRASMNRDGVPVPGRDRYQEYVYTFQGILSSIDFDLSAGDARLHDLRIEVVDNPRVDSLELWCEYPAYMARPPRRLPVVGPMRIPRFAKIVIEGRTNKPLTHVRIDTLGADNTTDSKIVKPVANKDDGRSFRYEYGRIDDDVILSLTPHDTDGVEGAEPARLVLVAVADEPPELAVQLSGIGSAVTPIARLPVVGQVRDEHGIAELWFQYSSDSEKPSKLTILATKDNPTELTVKKALDLHDLRLSAGHKFNVRLKASDRYDLGASPNIGESQHWQLDVVTPEQLRTMLQNRELTLRYRFEQIIQEVTDTRDVLNQIVFADDKSSKNEKPKSDTSSQPTGAEPEDKLKAVGHEPGDKPEKPSEKPSPTEDRQHRLAVATLRCERAIQNSRKNANEVLGTAEGFEDIREQLINNRIDTEELKIRLKSGVADPLREIGNQLFAELDRRLVALRDSLDDAKTGPQNREASIAQVDEILTGMKAVLSRMMELEDFNEAIRLLQEIIEMQENIEKNAAARHKELLRDLLED